MTVDSTPTYEQLHEEVMALRQHIVELENTQRERDHTIAELQATAAMYGQALDAVSDMVLVKGPQSRIVYANKAARDFYGMSLEELHGLIDAPFNDPNYTRQAIRDDDHVFSTGQILNIPQEFATRHDGVDRLFHTVKSAIHDADGNVVQTVGISRDITEQQQVEAALRESDLRFRQFAEHVPIVFFLHGPDGQMLYVSPAYDTVWGRSGAELMTNPHAWMDTLHPDDRAHVMATISQSAQQPIQMEYRVIRPNGEIRWVVSQAIPVRDADGVVERIVGFATDITARKQMELELQESEIRFRQMAENIGEVVWMSDLVKDRMEYISPSYERIWGRTCASLYSEPMSFVAAIHPDDRERVMAAMALQSQGTYDEEYRIIRPDGTIRWIRDRAFPIQDVQGTVYRIVGIAADITEHKQVLAEQQSLQETMIQIQAATLSELSTPLIPITDQVMVLPLIGAIDTQRAQQVLETLLNGVAEHHAHVVIVDITGVKVVDTQVANMLIQAALAVRMLGARVMLTGIRPEVAQTLVSLGTNLGGLDTAGTLQSGIAKVLVWR